MRVLHVITGLHDGGAEAVLTRLCGADRSNEHIVVSLRGGGKYATLLRAIPVDVHELDWKRGAVPAWSGIRELSSLMRSRRPDVVQTWLYHADLIGGLAARSAGIAAISWGIHNTTLRLGQSKASTIAVARMCAALSMSLPKRIVCCADASAKVHARLGYAADRIRVVRNGYGLAEFRPAANLRAAGRANLGGDPTKPWLGLVARYDPQKDHQTLLDALSLVRAQGADFNCLLVGAGVDTSNARLAAAVSANGLSSLVHMAGPSNDVPSVMNALDVHVMSSAYGEACPNVIAEAMACGTPCIATDVGDSAQMVGDTGWVVPPKDPAALANAIVKSLRAMQDKGEWVKRQQAARASIASGFDLGAMVAGYRTVWDEIAARPERKGVMA